MKKNSVKQQRISAELEAIIEEFGRAMRNANKGYIAAYQKSCAHNDEYRFTMTMALAWWNYVEWCRRNPNG